MGRAFHFCRRHLLTELSANCEHFAGGKADDNLVALDPSDPIPDSVYFVAAFLGTVGFFDVSKRFWTSDPLPDPTAIKTGMTSLLKTKFSPYYTEIDTC